MASLYGRYRSLLPPLDGPAEPASDSDPFLESVLNQYSRPAEPEQPSLLRRVGSGLLEAASYPAHVVDVAANYYSPIGNRVLSEQTMPDVPSVGQLAKEAIFPAGEAKTSYGKSIGREVIGTAADLARDPLSYGALGALGRLGRAGRIAETGAGLGFAATMGEGAVEAGKRAYETTKAEGFTPEAAGDLTAAILGGVGATLGARGAYHGVRGPRPEIPSLEAPATETGAPPAGAEAGPAREVAPLPTPAPPGPPGTEALQAGLEAGKREQAIAAAPVPAELPPLPRSRQQDIVERQASLLADQDVGDNPLFSPEVRQALEARRQTPPPEPAAPALEPVVPENVEAVAPVQPAEPSMERGQPAKVARGAALAQELGLPEDHPAVARALALEKELRTDPLTGIGNRRHWDDLKGTVGEGDHVLVTDLKRFKPINDQYGHEAGDLVLKAVGEAATRHFGDDAARFGGDEFGAVLRGLPLEEARARAEAFKAELASLTVRVRMPDGSEIDLPGIEAHIGVGHNAEAADLATNAAAAESRIGGRGDQPLPVAPASEGASQGRADRIGGSVRGPLAEPPNTKLPTIYQPEGTSFTTKTPEGAAAAGKVSPESASLVDRQLEAMRAAGAEGSPLFTPEANAAISESGPPPKGPAKATKRPRSESIGTDELGQPIFPGQEHYTPEERRLIRDTAGSVVSQIAQDQRADPTGRRAYKGGETGNDVEGFYGVPSHKRGTPLEDLPYTPKQLESAWKRDKGNPIEREIMDAVSHDERVQEALDAGADSFYGKTGTDPKFAVRPVPGQRGLPGVAEDIAPEQERRQPQQRSMFGGEMLQGTEARVTEGREAERPLFTQERDARDREAATRQGRLGSEPRQQNFTQYLIEHGVSDPTLEHGHLSPNGRISDRARNAFNERMDAERAKYYEAQDAYRAAVDRGEIIDPTGRYKPTSKVVGPSESEKLLAQAARERGYAKMAGGAQAKKLIKRAEALEAQAAALDGKAAVRPEPGGEHVPDSGAIAGEVVNKPGSGAESVPDFKAVRERIAQVFPKLKIEDGENGFTLPTPSGKRILVKPTGEVAFNPEAVARHGAKAAEQLKSGEARIAGATSSIGPDVLVQIADKGVLPHESMHVFLDHFAQEGERTTIQRHFEAEARKQGRAWDEVAADAYNEWFDKPAEVRSTLLQKFFGAIRDFASKVRQAFSPTAEGVFGKVKGGEVFNRDTGTIGGSTRLSTRAFHGSPHDFDTFDSSKIGSGEGAQVYGHGLYFAGNREVGNYYKQALGQYGAFVEGKRVEAPPGSLADKALAYAETEIEARASTPLLSAARKAAANGQSAEADLLQQWHRAGAEIKKTGKLYEVELAPDEADYLDWDKPLSQQNQKVQDAYSRILKDAEVRKNPWPESGSTLYVDGKPKMFSLPTGWSIRDLTGQQLYGLAPGRTAAEGSQSLAAAGIPGIRYLDQGSRGGGHTVRWAENGREAEVVAPDGSVKTFPSFKEADAWVEQHADKTQTHNYVIFDDKQVTTKAKYAIKPIPDKKAEAPEIPPKPTFGSKAYEFWINGLLSGPKTHLANATGNTLTQLLRIPEKAIAGALSRDRFVGEALADVGAIREGVKRAVHIFKDRALTEQVDVDGKVEHAPAIGGKAGRAVRLPSRLLGAADEAFKAIASTREARSQAYRKARLEGKKGQALADRMEDILENLDKHPEIVDKIHKEAQYQTFTDPLGKFGQALTELRGKDPSGLTKVIVPFMKTPMNIAKYTLERTPLNFLRIAKLYAEKRLKGGELADELAKPILGTMIGMGFALAAHDGFLTGGGPGDEKKKSTLRSTGWQPYSVKLGKNYYSFQRLEPFASIAGFAADMVEAKDETQQRDLVNKVVGSIGENLTNKTFLQGVENFFLMWSDPQRYASQYAKNLEGSIVPALVANVAQATDSTVRKTSALDASAIGARLPGVSHLIEPARRGTGEEVKRDNNVFNAISPVQASTEKGPERDLERVFVATDFTPSSPPRTITVNGRKVELDEDEIAYLRKKDEQATKYLRSMTSSLKRMKPEDAKRYIRSVYERYGDQGSKALKQSPKFRQRYRQAASART